jgi:hypothetical protein
MSTHAHVWVTSENPDHTALMEAWNSKTRFTPLPLHDFPKIFCQFDARNTLWGVLMDVRKGGLEDIILGKPQSATVQSRAQKTQHMLHIEKTPHQNALNKVLEKSIGGWSTDLLPGETERTSPYVLLDVFAHEILAKRAEVQLRELWFMRGITFAAVEVVFSRPH